MDARGFEADVTESGSETVVAVRGEVDVYTSPQLRERLDASIEGGSRRIVLDLSGTDFIDSTGIGVIVAAHKRARSSGGEAILRNVHSRNMKVLEIVGLHKALTFDPPIS